MLTDPTPPTAISPIPGKHYDFKPAVVSLGIPTRGKSVFVRAEADKQLRFTRGWYVGIVKGFHMFEGTPENDPRQIHLPRAHHIKHMTAETIENTLKPLRRCFFFVSLTEKIGLSVSEN